MSNPILHGAPASPFVRKVRVALAEKGVAYDSNPLMPIGVSEDYKKLSPLGKIPCWEEGDFVLPDSSAILAYLDRQHAEPRIYPDDAKELGRAVWYEEYADTKVVETVGAIFFQRVIVPGVLKGEPNQEIIQGGLDALPEVCGYLEGEIGDREHFVGQHFSIADITVGSAFVNLLHAGEEIDGGRWPNLRGYFDRFLARPSVKAIYEEEKAAFASN